MDRERNEGVWWKGRWVGLVSIERKEDDEEMECVVFPLSFS